MWNRETYRFYWVEISCCDSKSSVWVKSKQFLQTSSSFLLCREKQDLEINLISALLDWLCNKHASLHSVSKSQGDARVWGGCTDSSPPNHSLKRICKSPARHRAPACSVGWENPSLEGSWSNKNYKVSASRAVPWGYLDWVDTQMPLFLSW